ncbi:MAG: DUF1206 domain-containing protein [Rubrobacter sp.]|nr:DUF1206 domain-containing protein [Rubrobacter sp.]
MGVGVGVVGYGLHELYNAYQADFEEHLELGQISRRVGRWILVQGERFGLAARGIVIGIASVFLSVAALQFDPSEATGLGGALQELLSQPFGSLAPRRGGARVHRLRLLMLAVARYGQIALGRPF